MLLGQLLIAKALTVLFAKGYEGTGVMEGVRFGILVTPLIIAPVFIQYAVTPLPQSILWAWVGLGIIQVVLASVVAALVYRR